MTSFNRTILAGNLTRDPEQRDAGGSTVTAFGIAVNRKWKSKDGGTKEETDFFDIICWGKTGDLVAQYLRKGSGVLVEGRLKNDRWEDKDGTKRSKTKVVADAVQFLGAPVTRDRQPEPAPVPASAPGDEDPF